MCSCAATRMVADDTRGESAEKESRCQLEVTQEPTGVLRCHTSKEISVDPDRRNAVSHWRAELGGNGFTFRGQKMPP